MDEPFGAVDPLNREQLQDEFIRIQRQLKKTVIFVTHDIDEAIRLADYLVIMKDGEVVQADTPEQILASPQDDFVERFLGPRSISQALITLYCRPLLHTRSTHWEGRGEYISITRGFTQLLLAS
nr:hypothetical protein [uncultured Sphaerochaeta sp.]